MCSYPFPFMAHTQTSVPILLSGSNFAWVEGTFYFDRNSQGSRTDTLPRDFFYWVTFTLKTLWDFSKDRHRLILQLEISSVTQIFTEISCPEKKGYTQLLLLFLYTMLEGKTQLCYLHPPIPTPTTHHLQLTASAFIRLFFAHIVAVLFSSHGLAAVLRKEQHKMQFSNITLALMKGNLKEICQVLSSVPWNFTNGCKSQCNPNKYTIMDNTAFSFNPLKYMSEFLQYINRMGVCSCCCRVFFLLVFKIREKTRSLWLGFRKGNASDLHIPSVCTNRYTHTLRHSNDLIFRSYACRVPLLVPGSPPSCTFSSFRKTGMASLGLVLSSRELPSSVICSSIASNDPWSVITARNRSSDSSGALACAQCTQHRGRKLVYKVLPDRHFLSSGSGPALGVLFSSWTTRDELQMDTQLRLWGFMG